MREDVGVIEAEGIEPVVGNMERFDCVVVPLEVWRLAFECESKR